MTSQSNILGQNKERPHIKIKKQCVLNQSYKISSAKKGFLCVLPHIRLIVLLSSVNPNQCAYKRPYKSRFIANSSACTTTELSILLTSCLTAIKNHVIKYCTTVYERNGKNLFWSIKIQVKFLIN